VCGRAPCGSSRPPASYGCSKRNLAARQTSSIAARGVVTVHLRARHALLADRRHLSEHPDARPSGPPTDTSVVHGSRLAVGPAARSASDDVRQWQRQLIVEGTWRLAAARSRRISCGVKRPDEPAGNTRFQRAGRSIVCRPNGHTRSDFLSSPPTVSVYVESPRGPVRGTVYAEPRLRESGPADTGWGLTPARAHLALATKLDLTALPGPCNTAAGAPPAVDFEVNAAVALRASAAASISRLACPRSRGVTKVVPSVREGSQLGELLARRAGPRYSLMRASVRSWVSNGPPRERQASRVKAVSVRGSRRRRRQGFRDADGAAYNQPVRSTDRRQLRHKFFPKFRLPLRCSARLKPQCGMEQDRTPLGSTAGCRETTPRRTEGSSSTARGERGIHVTHDAVNRGASVLGVHSPNARRRQPRRASASRGAWPPLLRRWPNTAAVDVATVRTTNRSTRSAFAHARPSAEHVARGPRQTAGGDATV